MLSPPKPLDEIQPNLVCELPKCMGRATSTFFWSLERGQKVKYDHLISITKSFSKIFIPNFVCVFSQMKDTKHIRQDLHSVAWVMPQGWDFGSLGVPRGSKKKIQTWSCHDVAYQIDEDDEQNRMLVKFSS